LHAVIANAQLHWKNLVHHHRNNIYIWSVINILQFWTTYHLLNTEESSK
jgi:hypothetical protein